MSSWNKDKKAFDNEMTKMSPSGQRKKKKRRNLEAVWDLSFSYEITQLIEAEAQYLSFVGKSNSPYPAAYKHEISWL